MGKSTPIGGVSIHCVDVARGRVATGLQVRLYRLDASGPLLLAQGRVNAKGLLDDPALLGEGIRAGGFEAVFEVGDFYRTGDTPWTPPLSTPSFLEQVPYRFHIADAAQHVHLPFKFTPWGFSLFRGGA